MTHRIAPIKMMVLVDAITAMRAAGDILPTTSASEWARLLTDLALARNRLERAIGHFEVLVSTEPGA